MYKPVNPHPHMTHTSSPHMTDVIVAHSLLEHLRKEEDIKDKDKDKSKDKSKDKELNKKEVYQSPKRDNLCVQCGQQFHWCVCHLNEYQ